MDGSEEGSGTGWCLRGAEEGQGLGSTTVREKSVSVAFQTVCESIQLDSRVSILVRICSRGPGSPVGQTCDPTRRRMFFRTPFNDRLKAPIVAENGSIGIGSAGGM